MDRSYQTDQPCSQEYQTYKEDFDRSLAEFNSIAEQLKDPAIKNKQTLIDRREVLKVHMGHLADKLALLSGK